MTRTLIASALLGCALVLGGCSEHRMRSDYDRWTGQRTDRVDINTASRRQLERLPGIDADDADRIIANRPYASKDALVSRGIIGPRKFDRIDDYVYASGPRHRYDDQQRRYHED